MNRVAAAFMLLYFAASVVFAIGAWLFKRRLGPAELYRWVPRLQMLWVLIAATGFAAFSLLIQLWPLMLVTLAIAGYSAYYVVTLTRVCEVCGTSAQSLSLNRPAQYCPKCGSPLRPPPLFGD